MQYRQGAFNTLPVSDRKLLGAIDLSEIIPQRQCSACKEYFPLTTEHWHKDKTAKTGFAYACKECAKVRSRKWVGDNTERNKETCKNRYHTKTEEYVLYRQNNAEHIAFIKREWRKNNPDKVKKHKSDSQRRHRPAANLRVKRHVEKYPERARAQTLTRIARKKNAPGKYTGDDILRMFAEQDAQCAYCGIRLFWDIPKDFHVDHVLSLVNGGTNWPDNLVLACEPCNISKNYRTIDEWMAMRGW